MSGRFVVVSSEVAQFLARAGTDRAEVLRHYGEAVPAGVDDAVVALADAAKRGQLVRSAVVVLDHEGNSFQVVPIGIVALATNKPNRTVRRHAADGRLERIRDGYVTFESAYRYMEEIG